MKLFTDDQYKNANRNDLLKCSCDICGRIYSLTKRKIYVKEWNIKKGGIKHLCSKQCIAKNKAHGVNIPCKGCNKKIYKPLSQRKKYKNSFCSLSCSARYNNTHRTNIGAKRSKLELYIERNLYKYHPNLVVTYNDKKAIKAELDIYIPSLKIAFELNGIFHYEPIYGNKKLEATIFNDAQKLQSCIKKGIKLYVINTSTQKYYKEQSSIQFLKLISSIINNHTTL